MEEIRFAMPTFPGLDTDQLLALLGSGWLTSGPQVVEFERAFAELQGVEHAVAVSSCTAALHLALLAHGVGPGDEVITTSFTFVATANAIVQAGATPVFVDIDPDTLNLDPICVERAVNSRTRAIIPVHFAGRPATPKEIADLANHYKLVVIHDAAHATETRADGQTLAQYGPTACYSFYATKNLPIGEGGMLTTHDSNVARVARTLRSHGMTLDAYRRHNDGRWNHWDIYRPGFNYKMTDLQAFLGLTQIPFLDSWRDARETAAAYYRNSLDGLESLSFTALPTQEMVHAHHIIAVRVDPRAIDRDLLLPKMRAEGIGVAVNYRPIHELDWYRANVPLPHALPHASAAGHTCLSLPLHPDITEQEIDRVCKSLLELL